MFFRKAEKILEEKYIKDKYDIELEKNDYNALVIAAFTTLMPTLLFVFLLFGFIIYILFK